MPDISRFSFPTAIFFGAGAQRLVGNHLKEQGLKNTLIVTDKALATLPVFKNFEANLRESGIKVAVFSEVFGNPVKSQVKLGVKSFNDSGADCIVGFGGGAALDVAKAIALMVNHPGDLFDYEDDLPNAKPFDKQIPYWVALPTTSGTGSEVGRSAVVSDNETHQKKIIFSPKLLAKAVFADPELTFDLPAKVTAATGMDALTHCIEAYLAKAYHPICDGIALQGIRLVSENLVRCLENPKNLEARSAMMMASMMGAIAFQKGLGIVHSCAHALSTVCDLHHGLANGVMIDHALRHNFSAAQKKFAVMAQVVGLADTSPQAFVEWLGQLKKNLGIPSHLSELGVKSEQLGKLCDIAIADACHPSNPCAVVKDDFKTVFLAAL